MNIKQFQIMNREDNSISNHFLSLGINNFHQAIDFVWKLPYGRNSDRANFGLVLREKVGTCSTKHALLAELCNEQGVSEVQLILGIYEMNESNTPGVGKVLERHQLEFIPEAHNYLMYNEARFDFTNYESKEIEIDHFLEETAINPEQIGQFKIDFHRDYLSKWLNKMDMKLNVEALWKIREECILALSRM